MRKTIIVLLMLGVILISCKKEEEVVKSKEQQNSELAEQYFGRPVEGNYKGSITYMTGINYPTIKVDTSIVITKDSKYLYYINGVNVPLSLDGQKIVFFNIDYNLQGQSGSFNVFDFPEISRNGKKYYCINGVLTRLTY